jgi:hypothetical protein
MTIDQSKNEIPPNAQPEGLTSRTLSLIRRPLLGSFLFGLILGGVPLGLVLGVWYDRIMFQSLSDGIVGMFLMFTTFVATVGAVLDGSNHWKVLFYRAFLISLAMCVPIPLAVDLILLWKLSDDVLDVRNFPFHVALCVVWSIEVTVAGGLLALGYTLYRDRRSRNRRLSP